MRNVWGTEIVMRPEDFPPQKSLQARFRRCRCGEATFLDLPCRKCGSTDQTPVFELAEKQSRADARGRLLGCAVSLVVGLTVLGLLWLPLLIPGVLVAVLALRPDPKQPYTRQMQRCYWLFHRKKIGLLHQAEERMADPEALQEMVDAYDADLHYLERWLEQQPTAETAEQVYALAGSMAELYHNRRVSALMMKCLMHLPISEGICLDMDQICAFLHVEDFPKPEEILARVHECVLLTCLCPGEQTARFVVRFCADRIQRIQRNQAPDKTVEEAANDLKGLIRWFTEQERSMLSDLWIRSAVGLPEPPKNEPELLRWTNLKPFIAMKGNKLSALAQENCSLASYWFDHVWYDREGVLWQRFQTLVKSGEGPFAVRVATGWGKSKKEGA